MKKFNEIIEIEDKVIAVKDKEDVLKAAEALEKIGIIAFASKATKDKFIETGDDVENNFLIEDDEGWRIQSHYLGNGTSVDELEEKINTFLSINPNFVNTDFVNIILKDIEDEMLIIKNSFDKIENKLKELKS